MRIVLLQHGTFIPAHDGATKANRCMLRLLAEAGHHCYAVVPMRSLSHDRAQAEFLVTVTQRNLTILHSSEMSDVVECDKINVHAVNQEQSGNFVTGMRRLAEYSRHLLDDLQPDFVLVACGDPGHTLLDVALKYCPDRTVIIARTSAMLGFGPYCFSRDVSAPSKFQRVRGVIVNSRYLRDYIKKWAGVESVVMDVPTYPCAPAAPLCNYGQNTITMINPCKLKGISIFASMARRMTNTQFLAVGTWGLTKADSHELSSTGNVRLLSPVDDIESIFRQTQVLVIPSIWDEAFGRTAVEAMLFGIPVMASDVGGLPEAKLGVEYLIPVRLLDGYYGYCDDRHVPVPVSHEQDITPWCEIATTLLHNRSLYRDVSLRSYAAAHQYVASLSGKQIENYFLNLNDG